MKLTLTRNTALKISFFFDQCLPPILRDMKWFNLILFKLIYGNKARIFLDYKINAFQMTDAEIGFIYRDIESIFFERETNLNDKCIEPILEGIIGEKVLEVGAGKCFLAKQMSKKHLVTACDIGIDPVLVSENPQIHFKEGNIERLPFEAAEFDTVVCTHTLEHVQNLALAVTELRRVTKRRLIIVVPRQCPYRYTFDLHLHFFPYEHSLIAVMGTDHRYKCREVGGDWFYVEDH